MVWNPCLNTSKWLHPDLEEKSAKVRLYGNKFPNGLDAMPKHPKWPDLKEKGTKVKPYGQTNPMVWNPCPNTPKWIHPELKNKVPK